MEAIYLTFTFCTRVWELGLMNSEMPCIGDHRTPCMSTDKTTMLEMTLQTSEVTGLMWGATSLLIRQQGTTKEERDIIKEASDL